MLLMHLALPNFVFCVSADAAPRSFSKMVIEVSAQLAEVLE